MPKPTAIFFDQVRHSKKILVLDLGFLGDTIHLIPALWELRQALPNTHLEVMVADHIKSILELTPWMDGVLGYPRFPTSAGLRWHAGFLPKLRSRKYDAIINLNGSDRSSFLSYFSGAPLRLGRIPPKIPWYWKFLFTSEVNVPYQGPVFRQRWDCLRQAGFPVHRPQFAAVLPKTIETQVHKLTEGETAYLHISPFTTEDTKALPIRTLAELIDQLHTRFPKHKIALSCAPNRREQEKLEQLLTMLSGPRPWRVFAGQLSLVELAGIIAGATLHLGGDSGALHVALMMERATISWWRDYPGIDEWQPTGDKHRALIGEANPEGLLGIDAQALLKQVEKALC